MRERESLGCPVRYLVSQRERERHERERLAALLSVSEDG